MRLAKQKWVVFAWVAGAISGALISFYITDSVNKRACKVYSEHTLSWEENEAIERFDKDSPKVGIYAQERLISYAKKMKEASIGDGKNFLRVIGFAEGRKGVLYEAAGEMEKAEISFKKAIAMLRSAGITTNVDELKSLLEKSERSKRLGKKDALPTTSRQGLK